MAQSEPHSWAARSSPPCCSHHRLPPHPQRAATGDIGCASPWATAPWSASFRGTIAASRLTPPAAGRGKYVTFDVDPATFAVYDYAFTGAANPLDMTGGRRIVAYAGKVPTTVG
jgi:hypothetical protein